MSATPKTYSSSEEFLNIISHALGGVAVIAGIVPMMILAVNKGALASWAIGIYGITLLAMYLASSLYHAATDERWRLRLRRADHCSIYLLIAGTYTPLMLLAVGGNWGKWILIAVWSLALIGIAVKCFTVTKFKKLSIALYLLMGWLCLICIGRIFKSLSTPGLVLLITGGVLYTAGVLFYLNRRQYSHAVWHLFVLGGTISHFFMVRTLL